MHAAQPTDSPPNLTEVLARILRHEVGDLLQTIYATAAILQERLPPDLRLERKIVTDLRARAETCKNLLDTVHDYVCPLSLSREPVDLANLAAVLVAKAAARHPQLEVRAEVTAPVPTLWLDARRLTQAGGLLLANACGAAQQRVSFRTAAGPDEGEAVWTVTDDGRGVPVAEQDRIFSPYPTGRHSQLSLNLALAQKIVQLHGGRISAANLPEGGFRVQVVLPASDRPAK
jgi:two-component system sensor histidine kinase HydH